MYAPDTIIITWLLLNRKGVKGRIDNAGMPLIQLCQETAVSILQVYSADGWGKGMDNGHVPNKVWVPWEGAYVSVTPGNKSVSGIGMARQGHEVFNSWTKKHSQRSLAACA